MTAAELMSAFIAPHTMGSGRAAPGGAATSSIVRRGATSGSGEVSGSGGRGHFGVELRFQFGHPLQVRVAAAALDAVNAGRLQGLAGGDAADGMALPGAAIPFGQA